MKPVIICFIFTLFIQFADFFDVSIHINGSERIVRRVDEDLNLYCSVTLQTTSSIHFSMDWKIPASVSASRITVQEDYNQINLRVHKLQETDKGDYICIASKEHFEIIRKNVTVIVRQKKGICPDNHFRCTYVGHCIPARYLCDGYNDCLDASDESPSECGFDPCEGKIRCNDGRCLDRQLCCDPYVESSCPTSHLLPCCMRFIHSMYNHIHPSVEQQRRYDSDLGFLQSTIYTVIGCAVAFVFIVTIMVIAVCRVHMKRSAMTTHPTSRIASVTPNMGAIDQRRVFDDGGFGDPFVYDPTSPSNNPANLLVTYNIRNGIQFVGRLVKPPSYSEIVQEATMPEGPPPPYPSSDNLQQRSPDDQQEISENDELSSLQYPTINSSFASVLRPNIIVNRMGSQTGKFEQGSESPHSPTSWDWDSCLDFAKENFENNSLKRIQSYVDQCVDFLPNEMPSISSSCSSQSVPTSGDGDDNGGDGSRKRNLSQNDISNTADNDYDCDYGKENMEISENEERNTSDLGDVNVLGCMLSSWNTTIGHNFTIGSCSALEESFQFAEKNKDVLPLMQERLKNYWLQMKNQHLENAPTVDISQCPMADTKDESGTIVKIDFKHRTVLLDGALGSGKTVFVRQHGLNWAKGNQDELNNFILLFVFDPHNFKGSIRESCIEQASVNNEEKSLIWKIIQNNQKQVYIIIDDFDLLTESASKEMQDLLDGIILPGSHVLATCKARKNTELNTDFHKHYSMSLFTKNHIDQFFHIVGDDIKTKVYQMLHVDCRDMLCYPLFLHRLCEIAKTNPELRVNQNITNVYKVLISSVMSQKGLDVDFHNILTEFGDVCCRFGCTSQFYKEAVKRLNGIEAKLGLQLLVESDQDAKSTGEMCHQANQRSFTFFAMALYLSKLTDKSSFGSELQNTLSNHPDVNELFYRFFIGLIPDKIDHVFHFLPRGLTQSWNLNLINIFGEAGVFNDDNGTQFVVKMPNWIQLNIKPAYSWRDNDGFSLLQPIAVVNTDLNPKLAFSPHVLTTKFKHYLISLFELERCPITFIDLDLLCENQNQKCPSDFVLDFLTGIKNFKKVTRVRVTCKRITSVICDVIAQLFLHVKHVEISIKPSKSCDSGFINLHSLLRDLHNPKMESLDICIESSLPKHVLARSDIQKLCDLLKKCENFSELSLKPVRSESQIFDAILKLKLQKVVISYWTSKNDSYSKKKKNIPTKSLSEASLPLLANANLVLQMASKAAIKYLDVSGLLINTKLDSAFRLISSSQMKCLRMVDFPFGMVPCVDLSLLAPENRCWDLLDFSGWKIKMVDQNKGRCGSIKCLVAHRCDCQNVLEFVDKFKVEKVVCDDEHLDFSKINKCPLGLDLDVGSHESDDYCCNLRKLKVKCYNSKQISTQIGHFANFFSNLVKLKLMFYCEEFDLELGVWEKIKQLERIEVVHLVFNAWSKVVLENIQKGLELKVDTIKLTFDVKKLEKYDFDLFNDLFDPIHHQLTNNSVKVIKVSHKSFNYDEFLNVLEKWERERKLVLSLKLIKKNSKTCMTTIQLTL
uniref:Ig-like domain-containing protein n=1 Tax=Strigamia maritima TaxID=126957 RepID=T1JE00_STRMM